MKTPIILSHHVLYGSKKGQEKMSKRNLDGLIFVEDLVQDAEMKIVAARCSDKEEETKEGGRCKPGSEKEPMHPVIDGLQESLPRMTSGASCLGPPNTALTVP